METASWNMRYFKLHSLGNQANCLPSLDLSCSSLSPLSPEVMSWVSALLAGC